MKTTLLALYCILGLLTPGFTQNGTNGTEAIIIGQDPKTGDQIMAVGSGENSSQTNVSPNVIIITPEIIWPQKRKHSHHAEQDQP